MREKDAFSGCHPAVSFLFYGLVLLFSMFQTDPVCLALSLSTALAYYFYLRGRGGLRFVLCVLFPLMLLTALINPAFSHQGVTVLGYLPSGNPLTLESVLYGLGSAALLCAVVVWFACYNETISSDKLLCVFGKVIPALSLLLSMTLRFVPRFHEQMRKSMEARGALGLARSERGLLGRARDAVSTFSIVTTWSLENAVDTADSMRARGYGLPGRTAATIFRFDSRDRTMCCWMGFCGAYMAAGLLAGGLRFQWYPMISGTWDVFSFSFRLCFLLLCLTPLIFDLWEDRTWTRLRSGL